MRSVVRLMSMCVAVCLVGACTVSGSPQDRYPTTASAPSTGDRFDDGDIPSGSAGGASEPSGPPRQLQALIDGTALLVPPPELVAVETGAVSGLQVGYTDDNQRAWLTAIAAERQWNYMQDCLELVGAPPLIVVVPGEVEPLTALDDVLFDLAGRITASASIGVAGPVLQVTLADFDGSLGNRAFNLRSIMGRTLWLSAALPERDYPFDCARFSPG